MRFNSRSSYLHGNPKARLRAVKHYKRLAEGKVQHDQHIVDWLIKQHSITVLALGKHFKPYQFD